MTDSATIAAITTTSAPASRASTPSYSPAETVALPDTASLGAEDAKEQLRTVLRSHRRSRHRHSGHGHSSVCRAFTERALEALGGARSVAAYVSVGHEPCTRQLLDRLAERPPEPSGDALPAEAITRADALIIPALAVDRGGRRLGQGGGWYDRMLPLRRDDVSVFAMVYDDELVPGPLPTEPHDEIVDAVITPDAWFLLEGSAFAAGG